MGRPPIGTAAKTTVAACRLTPAEKTVLEARFGTVATFFRRMIDQEMQREAAK